MTTEADTNWKEIALALAQRVNFAMQNLKAEGSGMMGNLEESSDNWRHWTYYMAEAMEMIPGVKIDYEILQTMSLPKAQRRKAQKRILDGRKEKGAGI